MNSDFQFHINRCVQTALREAYEAGRQKGLKVSCEFLREHGQKLAEVGMRDESWNQMAKRLEIEASLIEKRDRSDGPGEECEGDYDGI